MSNELKPDWAAHQVDPAVARLWREHGGDHHGPRVETVTMPMSRLMGFVSDLGASAASPESAQIQPLEDKSPDIVAFLKTLNGYPDRLVEAAALQAANRIARLERELGEARNRGHRIGSYILSMRDLWDALDRLDAVEARAKSAESRLEAARVALEAFDRTDDEGEFPVAARSGTTVLLLSVPAIAVVKAREALALLNTAPTTTDDAT